MTRLSRIAVFAAIALMFAPLAAQAELPANRAVVRDSAGNVVRAPLHGACVHTQWIEGNDVCAPAAQKNVRLNKAERTVYFNFDKSDLTADAQTRLNTIADSLRGADNVSKIQIVGYADRIGSKQYNIALSKKRAETVQAYLQSHGILNTELAKVRWVGKSESKTPCPKAKSKTELAACLSPDRRVEVEVDYTDTVASAE